MADPIRSALKKFGDNHPAIQSAARTADAWMIKHDPFPTTPTIGVKSTPEGWQTVEPADPDNYGR